MRSAISGLLGGMSLLFGADRTDTQRDIQVEIEKAARDLEEQLKEVQTNAEALRVILAPRQRTVLSAQISTFILASQVSAPVAKIYRRMGEPFDKGDVLMVMDRSVFAANVQKTREVLARADAVLLARRKLYEDKIASYIDLRDAEAVRASAEADYILSQKQYEATAIIAPYKGRVVNLMIEENELPQPGQALIEIMEDSVLVAKVLVPSYLMNYLEIGKTISVKVKETGQAVDATIVRIGSAIDPSSATIAVDAEIDNNDRKLWAGMTGTTVIGPPHPAPILPPTTLPQEIPLEQFLNQPVPMSPPTNPSVTGPPPSVLTPKLPRRG